MGKGKGKVFSSFIDGNGSMVPSSDMQKVKWESRAYEPPQPVCGLKLVTVFLLRSQFETHCIGVDRKLTEQGYLILH